MILSIEHASVAYKDAPIVSDIHTRAQPGEFIGLLGPNGTGKSCLLKTMAGILKPHKGQMTFDIKNIHTMPNTARAKHIAYLAQNTNCIWPMPAHALVALGRAPYLGRLGKLNRLDHIAIDMAMDTAQCTDLKNRTFDQLSGGEQMRVHLARALAVDAPVLLADEPIASLDPYYQVSIVHALKRTAKNGKTVIASLHDLQLAKQFCTRIWILHEGRLLHDGLPDDMLDADKLAQVFNIKKTKQGWGIDI